MRILTNRITISLLVIVVLTYLWEFWVKPVTGPIYVQAVNEYKAQNYTRSLELLRQAQNIDPNDAAILALAGWNLLKTGKPEAAEAEFERAYRLSPDVVDINLGYAYTELELGKLDRAKELLARLEEKGEKSAALHVAQGTYYRKVGRNREAVREFQRALELDEKEEAAGKNLRELLDETGELGEGKLQPKPFVRPAQLTYTARAQGDYFSWRMGNEWKRVYLTGVDISPALPGSFPSEPITAPAIYTDWLNKISALGATVIRVHTLLPPGFYRALYQFNTSPSHSPLWLIQGVPFGDPPRDDMFEGKYYQTCAADLRAVMDVLHGQGDVPGGRGHAGGVYNYDIAPWVAGIVIGQTWPSHVVTGNNLLHPDIQSYQGTYVEVPAGNATEVFLAQMINAAVEYEVKRYNWQHPVAFLNSPSLDPLRHPTESTILEEVSIRRALGERMPVPPGPYDDDDGVAVDPMHVRPRSEYAAGYFAGYSVLPYYPDFINQEPRYQATRDAEGSNPFLGYLRDLKASHRDLPLLIMGYGIPTSMGIGHFSPAGFDEGGKTEQQQGQLLARLSRSVYESGAAGGTILEWIDQWFRQSWLVRDYETPPERRVLWNNFMNPAEFFGLLGAEPGRRAVHSLSGELTEWVNIPPVYSELQPPMAQPLGDAFDPARDLKALYADADEGFLYLRLVVGKLDNDNDGEPDWNRVNYLIGLGTAPKIAGLTYLPFITPVRFPMGMTYAIQLAGPNAARVWIASIYNPFRIAAVEGIPSQTVLASKLNWRPTVTDTGVFESQIIEPNRRRFGRDGRYFPPQRYDRGILRYGSLDPTAPDYDSLAQWHVNLRTNTIDLRIPWGLLNVTDPSSFKIVAGLERDGTVRTVDTPGFLLAAFSYQPVAAARLRPIMEQGHPIADALPGMSGPTAILGAALKEYRWAGWGRPRYEVRVKDSYELVRRAFQSFSAPPAPAGRQAPAGSLGGGPVRGSGSKKGSGR